MSSSKFIEGDVIVPLKNRRSSNEWTLRDIVELRILDVDILFNGKRKIKCRILKGSTSNSRSWLNCYPKNTITVYEDAFELKSNTKKDSYEIY